MAAVTKNINFFSCQFLLYYKSKLTQILTAATWHSHLEWRAGLSEINLKGTHPGTIPARFGLIWFSGF
jgi:hypothetical protein